MIFDHIEYLKQYHVPQTEKILKFIAENNLSTLPNGQIDIDGENLFVKVMEYVPKKAEENEFETHQIYTDLQYVVSGVELMQYVDSKHLTPVTEYDAKGDYQFFAAKEAISDIVVERGRFVVFYPSQAHRPACLYQNNTGMVKKLVFKVKI